jgi:hypothetical protein
MSRAADWFSFHATIDPIDTVDALHTALADPEQRWYGMRRIAALAASGAVVAASWNPNMHPRGRDGQFIEKFGWVRWFDADTLEWHTGWVSDINGTDGTITIRSGGDKLSGVNPKTLYSRPKPKALLNLPDPTTGKLPDKFVKVGGQGGSNPGALYQIDGSFANDPPDITAKSRMLSSFRELRQPGSVTHLGDSIDATGPPESAVPTEIDTLMIPRVDGTQGRYDVIQRQGGKWYRVPAAGQMTDGDVIRPELEVSAADAFGEVGSMRRARVVADLGTLGITRGAAFDVEDVADMTQQTASPLPGVGDKYYVKKMNIPERARSEALANDFYELLGIPVPEVAVGADGTTISSKLVGDTVDFDKTNPDHVKAVQAGFVADAWTANWDVIGYSFDNVQIDSQGRAWRIDAGGALEWRAQGKPKNSMFGDQVGELDSLRDSGMNWQAATVYGGITNPQLVEQATVLQSITPTQIQALADSHDMGHVGPRMIARRKSILDQLGIVDPPPDMPEVVTPPTTVYNPVEAVQQMGAPPTVAVHNYALSMGALPVSKLEPSDWDDTFVAQNAVFRLDGDLWVADGPFNETSTGAHTGLLRNLFTDERKQYALYDGEDEFLDTYTTSNVDTLVDNATPTRDLAIAEIVARPDIAHWNASALDHWKVNEPGDPEGMQYGAQGQVNWATFLRSVERHRLGKDNDGPLMHDDGTLFEVVHAPAHSGDNLILRRRTGGPPSELTLEQNTFNSTGTWFVANNDTTSAIWKSKYAPLDDHGGDSDPDGQKHHQATEIAIADGVIDDPADATVTPAIGGPTDAADAVGVEMTDEDTEMQSVYDDELGKIKIPQDKVVAWMKGEWKPSQLADEMTAAEPTASQKIVHGVIAGLSPSEPLLSTELNVDDIDALKAQLLGKSVVTMPIESYENPDWEGFDLGAVNGTGTVTEITTKKVWDYSTTPKSIKEVVGIKVNKPYSGYTWVYGGDETKFPKVVIPVEQAPTIQQVTFKKNGDIFVNGTKVGTHSGNTGIIDGDHSITGTPLHFEVKSGKQNLKNAASSLVNPLMPVPTKKKSAKELATEQKIKDLNDQLTQTQLSIEAVEQQLAGLPKGEVLGPGNPLNDGSKPAKGDWVYSVKDGTYAQVLNPNVVGFAGKGVLSPDMIKVKIQDPTTGKWKQSNRKRDQLVSVAAPGEQPFVMQTKAVSSADGKWVGPGVSVTVGGIPGTVLDTSTDSNVKVVLHSGGIHWVDWSQVTVPGGTYPKLKTAPGNADADALNAELDALNAESAKLVESLAQTLAAPTVKKKKPVGVAYPGPNGATVKQPPSLAEAREAKGLKNMKDGYVPAPGMVIRHNDGTQYLVYRMGLEHDSHKNSVYVAPVDQPTMYKWRALSTMVVDHEAMLTDKAGDPLPIVSTVEGADWSPDSGLIISKPYTKSYKVKNSVTGIPEWREKTYARYFIVAYDGAIYNVDGSKASWASLEPTWNSPDPLERIGYIDKSAPGGKKLTVSVQANTHHPEQVGYVQYAVIHDPNEAAAIPLAAQATPPPQPPPAVGPPVPAPAPTIPGTNFVAPPTAPGPATAPTPSPTAPNIPTTVNPTPVTELPVFAGKNPQGMELPHPPTVSSSAGVPSFQAEGGEPTLDVVGLPGAKSVDRAVADTLATAKSNKQNGDKKWVGTYGLADHDVIEDMMVRTQTSRDPQGVEYVEVSFRLTTDAARKAHTTFITSSTNQAGDWTFNNRNAKNLVPGDQIAVRVSGGGGGTVSGGLRPDAEPGGAERMPNATVIAAPVLIGKNAAYGQTAAGTYDVYRTQVMTAGGDIGFIDLEDRNGTDSVVIAEWDPTKPRTTNGAKGLNPNAANDGWKVASSTLGWHKATSSSQISELMDDGVKKTPGDKFITSLGSYSFIDTGSGHVLQRDYQGVHIEYNTTSAPNSLDGHTTIRVRADDPDAQRKISEAMELVGVSKEKQEPPDAAALTQMAANKVVQQLSKTWSKNMKANGGVPDALAAIDSAVGSGLPNGRKATIDDISLRVEPDGRVQVLVSEDVSRALVAKAGVKQYYHRFTASDWESMVTQNMNGEQVGLMASTERFSHGLWYHGKSSAGDHYHDSADHMFLTLSKSPSSPSERYLVVDPIALHRQVDYYWRSGDNFGDRQSNNLNWAQISGSAPGGNEMMLKKRFEPALWGHVVMGHYDREALIKKLHAQGITTAPNGMPLEDFFVTSGGPSLFKDPPSYGTEIPLANVAAPALAGV